MTMEQTLLLKTLLEGAYPSFIKIDEDLYIELLTEYDFDIMNKAIKEIIKTSSYPPTIALLIQEYKKIKLDEELEVIHQMNKVGMFYHIREYEKSLHFVKNGIVPQFLKDMIRDFKNRNAINKLSWESEYQNQIIPKQEVKMISIEEFFKDEGE